MVSQYTDTLIDIFPLALAIRKINVLAKHLQPAIDDLYVKSSREVHTTVASRDFSQGRATSRANPGVVTMPIHHHANASTSGNAILLGQNPGGECLGNTGSVLGDRLALCVDSDSTPVKR